MTQQLKVLVAMGTRPEVIKMAPIVRALRARPDRFQPIVCATAQHRQMLDQALATFDLRPDIDLDLMVPGQDLYDLTSRVLLAMRARLAEHRPDVVLVQGDTTTAFAVALAAAYAHCKIGHVEAGLRSGDKERPFPEEINRVLAGHVADFHFAPTQGARQSLLREGIEDANIAVTGNTVIDALLQSLPSARRLKDVSGLALDAGQKLILVTSHRRESFGAGLASICSALLEIVRARPEIDVVYPVHPNPNVRRPVFERLGNHPRIHLIEPQDYLSFLWLMDRAHLLLSDSGGVQEEGPALGKPVLVMREVTERPEAVDIGAAKLVGTDAAEIIASVSRLLDDAACYERMSKAGSPYGDGTAAAKIVAFLDEALR